MILLVNQGLLWGLAILCVYFAYTDIRERIIPNRWTHPLLIILVFWRLITMEWTYLYGLIPALIMLLIFLMRPAAIGAGDIKLFGIIGLVAGLPVTLMTIFIMGLLCMCYVGIRLSSRKEMRYEFPLAPFVAMSFCLVVGAIMII